MILQELQVWTTAAFAALSYDTTSPQLLEYNASLAKQLALSASVRRALGHLRPDPRRVHYKSMCRALRSVAEDAGVPLSRVRAWVDCCSIPQANAGTQTLAIASLPIFAWKAAWKATPGARRGRALRSCIDYFVVVAPDARHDDPPADETPEAVARRREKELAEELAKARLDAQLKAEAEEKRRAEERAVRAAKEEEERIARKKFEEERARREAEEARAGTEMEPADAAVDSEFGGAGGEAETAVQGAADQLWVAAERAARWQPLRPSATTCLCNARKYGRLGGCPARSLASPRSIASLKPGA